MKDKAVLWAKGLLAAAIGGAASAVTLRIVDPVTFNDWDKLGKIAVAMGLVNAAMYLKRSPLWNGGGQ